MNIGDTLNGRYTLTAQLGKGAMGVVFKATDTQTGQTVAVKVIARELALDAEMLERFRREGEALRQLRHPNIVGFVDMFVHDSQHVIVMEYAPGGNLRDLLKREGPLSFERTREIALDLCDALVRAHRLNIIHRDLKPENVLLAEDGLPRLTDFGVARLAGKSTFLTATGVQVGTPLYMSPEAWEGKQLDAQTDLWSLGVMLFEMLSGSVPFSGDTIVTVMNKVLQQPVPDVKTLRRDVPDSLAQIVRRLLMRDKEKRYATARQVSADLEACTLAGGTPVPERRLTATKPLLATLTTGPNRTLLMAGAAVVLLVACCGGGAFGLRLFWPGLMAPGSTPTVASTPAAAATKPVTPAVAKAATQTPPSQSTVMESTLTPKELPRTLTASPRAAVTELTPTPPAVTGSSAATGASWQVIQDLPRRVNTLVTDPTNPQILYAGTGGYLSGGAGVYKSADGGQTWQLKVKGLPTDAVKALALSNEAAPKLYAMVGTSGDLFASADGAETWKKIGTDQEVCCDFGSTLYVSPGAPQVLFDVVTGGGGAASVSRNGGQNWLPVKDDRGNLAGLSLAFDPANPQTVYLGTQENGVYKSTDGGATWAALNQGRSVLPGPITALAVAATQPPTLYAGTDRGQLFRSADGGQTWDDISAALPFKDAYRSQVFSVVTDPATPATVYVFVNRTGVAVSHDGGVTWEMPAQPEGVDSPVFTALSASFGAAPAGASVVAGLDGQGGWRYALSQPAPEPAPTLPPVSATSAPRPAGSWTAIQDLPQRVNALVVDPANPQILYAGTGGYGTGGAGLYKSADGGLTWQLKIKGLPDEAVKALALTGEAAPKLYAMVGTSGDVYASADGAESWKKAGTDQEVCCDFGSELYASAGAPPVLYDVVTGGGGAGSVSRGGGQSWQRVKDERGDLSALSLALDPSDPNKLYVGTSGTGIYQSADGGATWTAVNQGRAILEYPVTALAVDPAQAQTLYAGTGRGQLFKSGDGGQHWLDISAALPFDASHRDQIFKVLVDPAAPASVYVFMNRGGVAVSYDGGAAWTTLASPGEGGATPNFTALAVAWQPQLIMVAGLEGGGAWRYAP
jgi:photosystem II stability/assembly factor-like uncharacterized protein